VKKQKLTARLFGSYFTLIFLALTLIVIYASRTFQAFYFDESVSNLRVRSILVGEILDRKIIFSPDSLQMLCQNLGDEIDTRITLIDLNGVVIADSDENPEIMDNHLDRPEVIHALTGQEGISRRSSYTMEEEHLYLARLIGKYEPKIILRVSLPTSALASTLEGLKKSLILGGLLIILLLAIVNWYLSGQILKPVAIMEAGARRFAKGKLKTKLPESNIQELGSLGNSLNLMAEQIYDRIRIITQQKNEQLAILSSMAEGVLALDPQAKVISSNRAAAEMFGLPTNKILGRPLHEIIRNAELIDFATKVLGTKTSQQCRITIYKPEERSLNVVGNRMPAKKGAMGGAVLVFTDLTQIQKLEGVRKEFVANVSHELKTPVTSIQGYVETLLDGALDDAANARNFLGIIAKHASRLGQIVDDLLELSRIEELNEDEIHHFKETPLLPLVEATIKDFETAATSKSISIVSQIENDLKMKLNAKLFSHALGNLLDNAIKYSNENSRIAIRTKVDTKQIALEIVDSGHGIAKSHLDRIFERFYRVDKGRSREVGGTGLGLSIVKHIARVHHATLEVESKIGKGSTFRLVFQRD
jgi:two-component system phosphate regulon sensor histidine kinase PhoR